MEFGGSGERPKFEPAVSILSVRDVVIIGGTKDGTPTNERPFTHLFDYC